MLHTTGSKRIFRKRPNAQRYLSAYLLFLPVAMWFFIFCYLPMGGLLIAFKNFSVLRGIFASPWVGFANFQKLFSMPSFVSTVRNTLIISINNLVVGFPCPIIFALLLSELRSTRLKRFVQTVSYLPHFIGWSVAGGMIYMLLSPSTGVVNNVIRATGGVAQNFMGISKYFRPIVLISTIWKGMGWAAIIYIAAITGVEEQLYEAARIDGANRFQQMWHVTLPGIRSIISIQLILQIGNILNVSFDQIFILINDLTIDVGETLDYFVYRIGLSGSNNFSIATVSGMIKSIIGLFLVVGANVVSRKLTDGEGIW